MSHRLPFTARSLLLSALLALSAGPASAQTTRNSWPWTVADGAGFSWDIQYNGTVNNGSNDAYDGGMNLRINGSQIPSSTRPATLSADERELVLGSQTRNGIRVTRRIYIDPDTGYARWIDLFENTTNNDQTVPVEYYSNLGSSIQQIVTSSGSNTPQSSDWAFMTASNSGSRPAIVHIVASPIATLRPTMQVRTGTDDVYYRFKLPLKPKQTRALCVFHLQRGSQGGAEEAMNEFALVEELAKVPPEIGLLLANMPADAVQIGKTHLPRQPKRDFVVPRKGSPKTGKILNTSFRLKGRLGEFDLPADRVVGLLAPLPGGKLILLALTDGQVISGEWLNGPLRLAADGNAAKVEELDAGDFLGATWGICDAKPKKTPAAVPAVALRDGQLLKFASAAPKLTFLSEYGRITPEADSLTEVDLEGGEGGMHRLVFRNGSTLPGLLVTETIEGDLDLGQHLAIPPDQASAVRLSDKPAETAGLLELTLRNGASLFGTLAEPIIVVDGENKTTVTDKQLASLVRAKGTVRHVTVTLADKKTISGQFEGQRVKFQLQPGPTLPVFIGHIEKIERVGAKSKPKTKAAPKAKPSTGITVETPRPEPVTVSPRDALERKLRERIATKAEAAKKAKAEAADRDAKIKALKAAKIAADEKAKAAKKAATTQPAASK